MDNSCINTQQSCERHSDNDLCHYVIVRGDLPHGSQVAQTIHAVGETSTFLHPEGTIAVALSARNKDHLLELDQLLTKADIAHRLIMECDGEPMAIGLSPTKDRDRIRKVLSSLPLVK
jgi:hypothetical protein